MAKESQIVGFARADARRIAAAVRWVEGRRRSGPPRSGPGAPAVNGPGFWARITGSEAIEGADNQWTYQIAAVRKATAGPDGWQAIEGVGAVAGTAYNRRECGNTAELIGGLAVAGLPAVIDPETVEAAPIDTGRIVFIEGCVRVGTSDVYEFWFSEPNNIAWGCAE